MAQFSDSLRGYGHVTFQRDGFQCRYCGLDGRIWPNWLFLSVDHLLPVGHSERDHAEFVVTACRFCNESANRTTWEVEGRSPEQLVEQKKSAILNTRGDYQSFWEQNVRISNGRIPQFGELEGVEIRCCWPDEARDFTPWLTSDEGIRRLSDALGIDLAIEGREVPVGPYNADILARDTGSDALVVIENQLEKTNHDHLGKCLTYAALLNATTVVWIARSFTDEHRKVVEWLNEATDENLQVIGVEVEVWRIGNSLPAPSFRVVCAPNEAVRQAREAAREVEEVSDVKQLQLEFWTEVREHLERSGAFRSLKTPRAKYWYNVAIGHSKIKLQLRANTWDKKVSVCVYFQKSGAILDHLRPHRESIESEIGYVLDWDPFPNKLHRIIQSVRHGDIANRDGWPELAEWVTKTAVDLQRAFAPRIRSFSPETSTDE